MDCFCKAETQFGEIKLPISESSGLQWREILHHLLKLQLSPNTHSELDLLVCSHISFSPPCLLQQVQCELGEVLQWCDPQTHLMDNCSQGWH